MAIYHTRVKTFSRAQGHSSTAAAAYRAGLLLVDERTGVRHDYRRRGGVVETRCFAPLKAPEWTLEPQALWTACEAAERRKDSTVAREFEVALPHELTDEQRSELLGDLCRELVGRYGFAIQASIHEPPTPDGLNYHAHLLATTRRVRPEGLKDKTRELDGGPSGKAEVEWIREMVAQRINHHLAVANVDTRVDHRSLKAQAEDALATGDLVKAIIVTRRPTTHMGKDATALHRRGTDCRLADENAAIQDENEASFDRLVAKLEREGRLAQPTVGHGQEQAQRERVSRPLDPLPPLAAAEPAPVSASESEPLPMSVPAPVPASVSKSRRGSLPVSLGGGDQIRVVRGLGPVEPDPQAAAEKRRLDREKAARDAFAEAAGLWLEGFVSTIDATFKATKQLLKHQADRVAAFVHDPGFRADVRAFLKCLKRLKRDATRFARRLEAEDRAAHLLGQAQLELGRFDREHPQPASGSLRDWRLRRTRRLQTIAQRRQAHLKAREATGPAAQVTYVSQALDTAVELENLSQTMLGRYPVAADAQPAQAAVNEAASTPEAGAQPSRRTRPL